MDARNTIVKAVQRAHFKTIIIGLKQKQKVNFPLVSQLGLYLDNHDVLRCKGRLQYTDLPECIISDNAKTFIAGSQELTTLSELHGGVATTKGL